MEMVPGAHRYSSAHNNESLNDRFNRSLVSDLNNQIYIKLIQGHAVKGPILNSVLISVR